MANLAVQVGARLMQPPAVRQAVPKRELVDDADRFVHAQFSFAICDLTA
jgi:hypothetical protein